MANNVNQIGSVLAIYTSPEKRDPKRNDNSMISHQRITALAGLGLEGDRYSRNEGTYSVQNLNKKARIPNSWRQVTLISSQAIDEANYILSQSGVAFFLPEHTRRNILLSIEPDVLNALVGVRFRIGREAEFMGMELCTPCSLPALAIGRNGDKNQFEAAFQNLGGLRASVEETGEVGVGYPLSIIENDSGLN
jgi:hypothetical protein